MRQSLIREHDGRAVVEHLTIALRGSDRVRGLLGTARLELGHGLLLPRAKQVHTFGMRYPLDIVFLDRSLKVLRVLSGVRPNRMTRVVLRASWVLEVPAGAADELRPGMALALSHPSER